MDSTNWNKSWQMINWRWTRQTTTYLALLTSTLKKCHSSDTLVRRPAATYPQSRPRPLEGKYQRTTSKIQPRDPQPTRKKREIRWMTVPISKPVKHLLRFKKTTKRYRLSIWVTRCSMTTGLRRICKRYSRTQLMYALFRKTCLPRRVLAEMMTVSSILINCFDFHSLMVS